MKKLQGTRGKIGIVVSDRLRDQVYNILRMELRTGVIAAGDRLVEVAVAERLQVSRTPVREALFQLARDGLLFRSGRGYVLPVRTAVEIKDWLQLRRMLEPIIVERACTEATPVKVAALNAALQQEWAAYRSDNLQSLLHSNWKFRDLLWSMCESEVMTRPIRLFDDIFQAASADTLRDRKNQKKLLDFHKQIVSAIERRKPDEGAEVMRHFRQAVEESHFVATELKKSA